MCVSYLYMYAVCLYLYVYVVCLYLIAINSYRVWLRNKYYSIQDILPREFVLALIYWFNVIIYWFIYTWYIKYK